MLEFLVVNVETVFGKEAMTTEISCNQEETDSRIMFNGDVTLSFQLMIVFSPNIIDIIVNLIFHSKKTWVLQELYTNLGNIRSKKTVAVHLLVDQLKSSLVWYLPAIHSLSGCNSTSKGDTKLAA